MFHSSFRSSLLWLCCLFAGSVFGQFSPTAHVFFFKKHFLENTFDVANLAEQPSDAAPKPEVIRWKNKLPIVEETVYLCPREPYIFKGETYFAPNQLTDTLSGANADTVLIISLIDLPTPTFTRHFTICQGELLQIDGLFYDAAGIYPDTIFGGAANGCDSVSIVQLDWGVQPTLNETIRFCPGKSVKLGGKNYFFPGTVQLLLTAAAGAGCDTFAVFTLEWLPEPTKNETIRFCQGETVVLGGQIFDTPGLIELQLPSTNGGCDTFATFQLVVMPRPKITQSIRFCDGENVWLNGQTFTESATVQFYLPAATGGCDTLATYFLEKMPLPTQTKTILTCPTDPVLLGGKTYFAPDTVQITLPATQPNACDTLQIFILKNEADGQSSQLTLQCPANIDMMLPSDATETVVNFQPATAFSDCTCPETRIEQLNGWASGSNFSVGTTNIIWRAEDACGSVKTCNFSIKITTEAPCDEAKMACMTFELLSIRRDAQQNLVYRIRATNRCATPMNYFYVGLPQGVEAVAPANNTIFDASSGREYLVRQPNFSPVRSVRFKNMQPNVLVNGVSDIFRVVLPSSAAPSHIYVAARMDNQQFDEWYLHTANCPIGTESSNRSATPDQRGDLEIPISEPNSVLIFPNPAPSGAVLQILGREFSADATFSLMDGTGRLVFQSQIIENQIFMQVKQVFSGVYFYKIIEKNESPLTGKLIIR